MRVDEFLSRLHGAQKHGDYWTAKCPAHQDDHASLSVSEGNDGRVLVKCHAGCETEDIVGVMGLVFADLMPEERHPRRAEVIDTYEYVDKDGHLLFQVLRKDDKTFPQRRPDGSGGWAWNLQGVERVLYRLPRVIEAVAKDRWIFVVEGEKDVHTAERLGFVATTNPMGAGSKEADRKWLDSYTEVLVGAKVIVIPDNDEQGHSHAQVVRKALSGKAKTVVLLELPGLGKGEDLSDWVVKGGTADRLKELVRSEILASGVTLHDAIRRAARYKTEPMEPSIDYPWEALNYRTRGMRAGWLCILAGYPGSGKTAAALETALAVAKRGQRVLFDSLEMDVETLSFRVMQRYGLDTNRLYRGHLTDEDRDAFDEAVALLLRPT